MSSQETKTAQLSYDGNSYDLPVHVGTENETAVDISKLRSKAGLITLDPGYGNTGSCKSSITYIDGDKGILRYRGYAIEDLAKNSTFLEVAYLLLNGELPNKEQNKDFTDSITHHTMLNENFRSLFLSMPTNAHPMPVMSAAVSAMSCFYQGDEYGEHEQDINTIRLISKIPTLAAWSYKHSIGQPFLYPKNHLSYAGNFLKMMFGNPCEEFEVAPVVDKALDILLILHADHEQNCSTSTVRMVGSSHANLFASISAGVSALWGPLHGGANQKVIEMLSAITDRGETAESYVEKAKNPDDPTRLMGFGHRVYKNYDPRAAVLKGACHDVIERLGIDSKQLEIGMKLEEIALNDEYFVKRKLFPNVDFYSGIIYKALGIPVDMFTVMFAMGRLPGWIAQWREMNADPAARIDRPRQVYMGANERKYFPNN